MTTVSDANGKSFSFNDPTPKLSTLVGESQVLVYRYAYERSVVHCLSLDGTFDDCQVYYYCLCYMGTTHVDTM